MRYICPLSQRQWNFILLFSQYKTFCKKQKNTRTQFMLLGLDLQSKWTVFNWLFPLQFRVSTQIMLHDYCIPKCKTFSACRGILMPLRDILFAIRKVRIKSRSMKMKMTNFRPTFYYNTTSCWPGEEWRRYTLSIMNRFHDF